MAKWSFKRRRAALRNPRAFEANRQMRRAYKAKNKAYYAAMNVNRGRVFQRFPTFGQKAVKKKFHAKFARERKMMFRGFKRALAQARRIRLARQIAMRKIPGSDSRLISRFL